MKPPTSFFRIGKSFQKATVILLVLLVAMYAIRLLYAEGGILVFVDENKE